MKASRSQIDRLGERLRDAAALETADLRLLDQYRQSHTQFSNELTMQLRKLLSLPITERPGKTTPSIVAKLKRQRVSLSRMQDISGGRVVVADLPAQDEAVNIVCGAYPDARVIDRRQKPMFGYHAVHVVLRRAALSYELQIRTEAQQRWAQLSEKFADLVGFEIKYGGGPDLLRKVLESLGVHIHAVEEYRVSLRRAADAESAVARLDKAYVRKYSANAERELTDADAELEESYRKTEELIPIFEGGPP